MRKGLTDPGTRDCNTPLLTLPGLALPAHHQHMSNRTTAVLLGYSPRRAPNYHKILNKLSRMTDIFDGIILVWNNLVVPPPLHLAEAGAVPVTIIQSQRNSLCSRYNVSSRVISPSVLIMDDDVIYERAAFARALASFSSSPRSRGVVGFAIDARHVARDGTYRVPMPANKVPNMIIGKTMLFAREHMMAFMADANLTSQVDPGGACASCDDLALNALVMNRTNNSVVTLPLYRGERHRLPEYDGVSTRKGWVRHRTACARWLIQYFGWTEWPLGGRRSDSRRRRHRSATIIWRTPAGNDERNNLAQISHH